MKTQYSHKEIKVYIYIYIYKILAIFVVRNLKTINGILKKGPVYMLINKYETYGKSQLNLPSLTKVQH